MNDFVSKLFPFDALFETNDDTLTAVFVLFIILIFLCASLIFFFVIRKLKGGLKRTTKNFSEDGIRNEASLNETWKDYQKSFIEIDGLNKTDEFANSFFNEKNVLSSNTNLSLISSIPSILVGFGILGTFVGLTFGISNFQTSSTEEIKKSIETLLSGMGTAFISSLWGMGLSILFTFLEKVNVNSLRRRIHDLCYLLDRKYKVTKEDERQIALKNSNDLLLDHFSFTDDEGNMTRPGNVLRDLYNEAGKQSSALQSFSVDLANVIEAGFEKILNDPDRGVMYELQELKSEIISLGTKLQDPATEMIGKMLDDLKGSLGSMVDEFNQTVSGSAKSEMEGLATLLGQAGQALNDFPAKLEEMTFELQENFKNLQEIVKQISQSTLEQSEHSTEQMRRRVEEMSGILKQNVGELQVGQEVLLDRQKENMEVSSSLLAVFKTNIETLNELSASINGTVSEFKGIEEMFISSSNQLADASSNSLRSTNKMKEAQNELIDHSMNVLEKNGLTIEEINTSLSMAKNLQLEYSEKFNVIEEGLQGIFQEINTGLLNYRDTVGNSLEQFLGRYSQELTNTAQSLSGAASKLEEIVEELTEQLSDLQNGRG